MSPEPGAVLDAFERDVLLATGRAVRIRAADPSDVGSLRSFYDGLTDESRHLRFFGVRSHIPERELVAATAQSPSQHVTLLVHDGGEIIGVGEYFGNDDGTAAEVAFAVTDRHHHEGVATLLLEDLATIARAAGFRHLVAETLPDNAAMRRVFRSVGLVSREWFEDGVVRVQLDLTGEHLLQDDSDLRDWRSAVRSLRPILDPTHVVVLGVGRSDADPGRRILSRLERSFSGRISVIHPSARHVGSTAAVSHIAELDPVPDLAIVSLPAAEVIGAIDECGRAGVAAAVITSSGFAEAGAAGTHLQAELLRTARSHGMRVVGPNCLGVESTANGLVATFATQALRPGGIAIAAQSGGAGTAISAAAERRGAGISAFVSMGDKIDVSGNDLLRLWADDDRTRVVLLSLESFGNPQRFARVARAVARRKPVFALFVGRAATGAGGHRSQSAAFAADDTIVDALFDHTGVGRARSIEALIDVGLLLDSQPPPGGNRVVLIGNDRGLLNLGAYATNAGGLEVPELSLQLQANVRDLVARTSSTANPVELPASASAADIGAVTRAIETSGEIDACILVVAEAGRHSRDVVTTLGEPTDGHVTRALVYVGGDLTDDRIPVYPEPDRAVGAVALAARRADWLARIERDEPIDADEAEGVAFLAEARRLARSHSPASGSDWLEPGVALDLIASIGIPVARWQSATSADECAHAATTIGLRCVVKVIADNVVHKSEVGGVIIGVTSAGDAADAYRRLAERFGHRFRGALVQAQVESGVEVLVSAVRDPQFGPFVMVAAGGTEAEILDDRAILVAPVTMSNAIRAIEQLRIAPLFHGYRGRASLPVDRLAELVHRVGTLAATVPEMVRIDLNPVIVHPAGCVAVDVSASVNIAGSAATPLRGLLRINQGRTA